MKKKLIFSIVAAVTVVAVCGALAFTHFKKVKDEVDMTQTNKLKVYVFKNDGYMSYILDQFKTYYSDIDVERVTFDNYDQFVSQVKKDATKKGGPDVLFDSDNNGINLRKLQMNDSLVDLKPLLKKDEDFVFEDYNDAAFNACSYDGKLTAVPTSYIVPAFYAGEKTFDSNLLKKGYSLKDFVDAASKSVDAKKSIFTSRQYIYQIIGGSGVEFIDYKNKKLINEDKLQEIMEDCKKLYTKGVEAKDPMQEAVKCVKNKSTVFVNAMPGASIAISTVMDSGFKQFAGEHAKVYGIPTLEGGTEHCSMASSVMCIPKTSANKRSALDFIEFVLSSPIQNGYTNSPYTPVRIEDYITGSKTARQNISGPQEINANGTTETLDLSPISDDLNKETKDVINKTKKCRYMDMESYECIYKGVFNYASSAMSKDKALSEIKDEINKYFKN